MLGSVGLPHDQISPKSLLLEPLVWGELGVIIFDELFKQSNDQLGIFADYANVAGRFDCYSMIVIVAFVETNYYFI